VRGADCGAVGGRTGAAVALSHTFIHGPMPKCLPCNTRAGQRPIPVACQSPVRRVIPHITTTVNAIVLDPTSGGAKTDPGRAPRAGPYCARRPARRLRRPLTDDV